MNTVIIVNVRHMARLWIDFLDELVNKADIFYKKKDKFTTDSMSRILNDVKKMMTSGDINVH